MSKYNHLPSEGIIELPELYTVFFANNSNKDLKSETIGDLLRRSDFNNFILNDIYQRIIQAYKHPWNENQSCLVDKLISEVSVCQCESIFRWFMNDLSDKVNERYPNITNTGVYFFIVVIGWLLPYYVYSDDYLNETDFQNLPPIEKNLRPPSKDYYPHPFALHCSHQMLYELEKVYFNITIDDIADSHTPAHKKATQARADMYAKKSSELESIFLNMSNDFKKMGIKSASKQASLIWLEHGNSIGYELSTIEKKIRELIKKHK